MNPFCGSGGTASDELTPVMSPSGFIALWVTLVPGFEKKEKNVWYKSGNISDTAVWTLIICLKKVQNESTMRATTTNQWTAF